MPTTTAIFAYCKQCGARRMFDRTSKRGYACQICRGPKPKRAPILRRVTRG